MTPIDDFYTLPPDEARSAALRRYVEQKADMERRRTQADERHATFMRDLLASLAPPPPMIAGIPVVPPDAPTMPWAPTEFDREMLSRMRITSV